MDPQPPLAPEALLQSLRSRFEELCRRVAVSNPGGASPDTFQRQRSLMLLEHLLLDLSGLHHSEKKARI
ncbi:MAG: hypothetical protein L0Z62_33050 [Gemmataceae bacterium]|nr:hypothetical protein [Gemmataceae bacterium]